MSASRRNGRERLGADSARVWARELELRNPYGKAILLAVANYMNEDGAAWPGTATIARDTDISEDTVVRRLRWLGSIGAIALFKRWRDENGRANYEGRGKPTSNEIRFLFDADQEDIEARARGETGGGDDENQHQTDPAPSGGKTSVSPPPAPRQPPQGEHHHIDSLEPEPEKKESPLPPKGGEPVRIEESEAKDWPGSDTWPEFEAAWGEPILRQSIARQVWSALTPDERALAIKAARGYMLWRRSQKKPPNIINAHTFLRETDAWAGFAKQIPPEVIQSNPAIFVAEGSESWQALCVIAAIGDELPPVGRMIDGYGRGLMRSRPLTPQQVGLARFAIEADGKIDTSHWRIVKAGTNQCGAWRELTGFEPFNVWTGETKRMEVGSKVYENWKVMTSGLRVPSEWPPRKDGSLCTGPPPGHLTEEGARAFTGT